MVLMKRGYVASLILALCVLSFGAYAQKASDATMAQRLDVMRQKLETIRRSAASAASMLKKEGAPEQKGDKADKADKSDKTDKADKGDNKESLDTPYARLHSLEKDASTMLNEVNNLKGKVDRSEKVEAADVDRLEGEVTDLQRRADQVQSDTASARANAGSEEGSSRDIKKKKKFLGIFGKGGNDEFDELIGTVTPGRDRELFIVATREVRKKNFDVGRLLFQTIITTYPDSPYLPMSKLAVADSFFLEGDSSALIQAIAAYQDWLTFFPTHPLADRVVLKIAESEMRQIGLPDREATHAKRAEVRLKALMQSYPNSILKPEAQKRLDQVQDNLGLHSLYIANYYYTQSVDQKKGGLKGAQSRYREIITNYPNFSFADEALYKLAVTYMVEEETDQAARYFQRIVSDFPNSDYVAKSKEQLQNIGATVPETNPERAKILPPEGQSFFANFKNQLFGIYPMTIDKDGVLMTKDFDKEKFELIDQIIENQGDIFSNQIPNALTTVISQRTPQPQQPQPQPRTTQPQK